MAVVSAGNVRRLPVSPEAEPVSLPSALPGRRLPIDSQDLQPCIAVLLDALGN